MQTGWVSIYRKMLEWEWYDDSVVFRIFIHLLLSANHQEQKWRGITIERGQLITSIEHIVTELNRPRGVGRRVKNRIISIQSTRTALNKLLSTGEITIKATREYSLITINNYGMYQTNNNSSNKRATNEQQTSNKRATTNNNDNNINNENNENNMSNIREVAFNKFEDLTEIVIRDIAERYRVSYEFVEERRQDMEVWIGKKKTNRYKDYKLALMKWVRDERNEFMERNMRNATRIAKM